nr:uncharacterized protein LOC113807877 [Penaeus vannamei]
MKVSGTSCLLLGLLATLVHAQNEAVCASSCRFTGDGRPGVHFVPGHTYQFQYQGEAVTSAKVTEGQESRFSVKAAVSISARNPCDLKMEVSEIGVEGIPEDQIAGFVASVQTYDLHFSYQDGEIEYLCPHEKEDPAATNFKRGVLSALQTTVTKVDDQTEVVVKEIDVGGDCETRYSIQNTGKLTVTKKKENCRSTAHFPYIPHVRQASYSSSGDLPFFRRTQSCQLILGDAVWERVECTEELQVEGSTSSLASVLLTSRLELQDVLGARSDIQEGFFSLDEPLTRKESLRMDLESSASLAEPQGDQDALKAQLEQTLEYLVASLKDAKLQEGRPFAFAGLVSLMGRLEGDQLERLWDDYRSKSDYREFFLDGLTSCEREQCVRLVAALAQEDTAALPDSRLKTWLAGVHFHAHADPLSLQHVMDLANSYTDVPSSVLLAASSMVHRLCRDDPLQCRSQAQPFLAYVEEKVGDTCGYGETRDRQREVMVVLRALGNAGLLPFEAFPEKCYLNRALASDVRTAALQTYRRLGCVRTDSPWQILEDEYDSVEVRIKAYLALVSCASETPGFFSRIEKVLDRETVHQVGSFIWTHVRNLAEEPGVSEYDQELAKLASHPTLNSKFNTNPLRSSRNYRYAHFSEILNGGGSLDSNVIFSDSYVPRHASVNLTVDILQNSFNVLEIGGDFVALEEYVDRILGREASKDQIEKEKILKLQRLYDEARTVNELTGLDDHESRASVFFRVFGHEVVYLDNVLNINPLETLQQLVSEFTVPKSFQLLNQECVSPTLLGFPLRLKVNATGSLVLTRDGTFEMTGHGVMLEGHLNPSAVVAVEETLAVDGFGFLSGIRRRTTQTSHMQLGLKVEVVKGQLVDVQLNMPEEEIAQVRSSVQVGLYDNAQGGWKELQEPEEADGEGPCTPDTFNKVVGLKFCANRGLVITRTDTFDHYKFSFENRDGKAKVLFDTPGSSVDRQFSLEVNTNPENFGGSLVFPGKRYDLKGEAVSTQRRKRFKMKYLEDSNTKGELDLLINRRDEGFKVSYTSGAKLKLKGIGDFSLNGKLAVGDDALSVEGTLISSLQYEPIAFKASWERDGDQHSLEGLFAAGQLGSATGSASVAPSSVKAQLKGDYSYDRPEPHTFSVTLDLANKSGGRGMYKGHVTATSTQAEVNLDVSYLYQENLLEFMADTAVLGKETKAQLVLRNVATEADRDVQLSASFACPQLDVDYSADFIYLSTPTALRLESGVGLGSLVQAKGAFTYAFEEEPFRALAGVHLELNGRGAKAAFDFDLSQSHRALGLVSVSVGSASSELRVDLQYDPSRPLNVTLEALGGNDPMTSSGVTLHTSSDPSWTVFQGNARVKWQEWSSSISHNVTWLPDSKAIQVILGDAHVMEVKAETAPDLLFSVLLSSDQASAEPEFQAGIQRVQSPVQTDFKLYLTSGTDKLLRFTAVVGSNQTFGGNFRLLESQLEVIGSYEHPYAGDLQGTAAVRMVLPSGQTYSSDLALNHTYDGVTRNLMVSSTYGDDMLKGHMTIKQEDGWFSEPVLAFALSLSTPFTRLGNVGFAMESRGDSSPSSAEFQWDELKVRAEAQLEDLSQLEMKFLYEDGGTCDSHFHLYNKYRDGHYMTGISLDLTASYDPWMVEVNTTLGYGTSDLMINVGAPVLSSPYQAHLSYELTSTIFEFDAQIGMAEGESAAVTFSGQREAGWDSVMRSGSLMVDTPWTEPLVLNVTNYQESDLIHVSVDLTSTLGGINSVRSEFGIYYTKPGETQLQFNVTHEQLVIELELNNKHSRKGYTQQLKGTVNDIEITYALETEWDHSFIPETADGQIAITNLLDHNLNLTVSHNRNSSTFSTKIFGSWGDQLLQASHILEFQNLLDWSSVANIVLPSKEEIKSELSLSAEADFSSFQSNLNFTSPWTDNIVTVATAVPEDSSIMYELISIHRDSVISRATLRSSRAFGWDHSDFMLDVSSTYFENCSIAWEHGVDYGNLIFMEATYGSDFLIQATSNLTFSQGWFSQEFSEYLLLAEVRAPVQGINFKANLHFDSQYNGNVEALWDGSSVMAKSAIFDGVIFKTLVDIPDHKYQADLEYTEGINEIPNFDFKLAVKDEEILIVNTTTTSLYPKLDVQLTFQVLTTPGALMQTGMLNVTMDLSQVEDFTFLGSVRFLSDFAGFENYGLHVETNVNLNPNSWDVGFDIKLFANEETYNLSTSASLALDDLPHLKYEMAYDMNFNDQLLDQKEVNFMFGIPQYGSYQTNVTLVLASDIPQWALFMSYNNTGKDIKGYVIPGDENKYEVAASLNTDNLVFNSQRVGDDGSTFIAAEGKITWDVDSPRKQITLTMNSDIEAVKEVSGEILITESRGFEVSANFMLNQQKFTANLRYEARGSGTSGRAVLEVEIINFWSLNLKPTLSSSSQTKNLKQI